MRCGVSQGSIFGPLLFLINTNDIDEVTEHNEFGLFTDNTKLYYSHDKFSSLRNIFNSELSYDSPQGYTFSIFSTAESKCSPINPCKNGATCQEARDTYKCFCRDGFSGYNCEGA